MPRTGAEAESAGQGSRDQAQQGKATVFSKALVEENRYFVKSRMGPRELGWFFRLVVSPEPEHDRFFHTRKRGRTQVSKGLKRTAGRDERAQHTPGALNLCGDTFALLNDFTPNVACGKSSKLVILQSGNRVT